MHQILTLSLLANWWRWWTDSATDVFPDPYCFYNHRFSTPIGWLVRPGILLVAFECRPWSVPAGSRTFKWNWIWAQLFEVARRLCCSFRLQFLFELAWLIFCFDWWLFQWFCLKLHLEEQVQLLKQDLWDKFGRHLPSLITLSVEFHHHCLHFSLASLAPFADAFFLLSFFQLLVVNMCFQLGSVSLMGYLNIHLFLAFASDICGLSPVCDFLVLPSIWRRWPLERKEGWRCPSWRLGKLICSIANWIQQWWHCWNSKSWTSCSLSKEAPRILAHITLDSYLESIPQFSTNRFDVQRFHLLTIWLHR